MEDSQHWSRLRRLPHHPQHASVPIRFRPLSIPSIDLSLYLLACLRMLIRRCIYENTSKDEIQDLFSNEVQPELRKLLTILLQKFQREWREDVEKDQVNLPRLKAMTWNMANQETESTDPAAVINLKLQNGHPGPREMDVKFQLAKDTLETMVKSMYSTIKDQLSENNG